MKIKKIHPVLLFSIIIFLCWVLFNLMQNVFYKIFYILFNEKWQSVLFLELGIISFVSLALSIGFLFYFKKYKYLVFIPFLFNGLTIAMNFMWPASASGQFYSMTKIELPKSATNINDYSDPPSFLGDGTREFSFSLSKEDVDAILKQKPFKNSNWEKGRIINNSEGCIFNDCEESCGNVINHFCGLANELKFRDSDNLLSATNDRSPDPDFINLSNYDEVIFDPINLWMLVIIHDS